MQLHARAALTIESLMPVSIATMRGPGLSGSRITGSAGVTSQARSAPAIGGSAITRSRASDSGISPGNTPPRIAPLSRMWSTRARVSTPLIAGIPQSVSHVSQAPSAPGASSRFTPSRITTARAWMRSDSIASDDTP
jgi:hypothetical protein